MVKAVVTQNAMCQCGETVYARGDWMARSCQVSYKVSACERSMDVLLVGAIFCGCSVNVSFLEPVGGSARQSRWSVQKMEQLKRGNATWILNLSLSIVCCAWRCKQNVRPFSHYCRLASNTKSYHPSWVSTWAHFTTLIDLIVSVSCERKFIEDRAIASLTFKGKTIKIQLQLYIHDRYWKTWAVKFIVLKGFLSIPSLKCRNL